MDCTEIYHKGISRLGKDFQARSYILHQNWVFKKICAEFRHSNNISLRVSSFYYTVDQNIFPAFNKTTPPSPKIHSYLYPLQINYNTKIHNKFSPKTVVLLWAR